MERETWFHNKIIWFTFVFSILVVWVHSANGELFLGQSREAEKVIAFERFLGNTIGQVAVPGFFMMSGYLFYRNFKWKKLGAKWNSRIRSVLVPFLLWNGIYYMGYVIASRLPVVTDIVEKGIIPFDWYTAVEALLHYTYNYVFWYLYQLILLIMLAPVLYGILRHRILGIIGLMVSFYVAQRGMIIPYLNLDALFYYSLAAYGGLHGTGMIEGAWGRRRYMSGALLIIIAVTILSLWRPCTIREKICFRTLVPVGFWLMVEDKRLPAPREWMKYNFYLYAVHFALVRLINKTAARFSVEYWLLPVILFLLMPVIMVCFSFSTGRWMKKHVPDLWLLLNGGR